MHDVLLQWVPWGIQIVLGIQRYTTDGLDLFFRLITNLGGPSLYVVTSVIFFWWIDKRLAARLAALYLLSHYINHWVKIRAAIERPFVLSELVVQKAYATGYSFPSGHAQATTTLWLSWCLIFRRRWLWPLGAAMVVLVSFSRLYLGVHYPQDVVAGVFLGGTLTLAYLAAAPRVGAWLAHGSFLANLAAVLAVTALLTILVPDAEAAIVAGAIGGLLAGFVAEVRWLDYEPDPTPRAVVSRVLVGGALVGLVYLVLALALPDSSIPAMGLFLVVVHYSALGLAATLGAGWAFVRLGLARARR
ncbi:MAG: phosphatase PAP2 family protein [Anaerolineae bacterium]